MRLKMWMILGSVLLAYGQDASAASSAPRVVPITVSKETTGVTAPLLPDGTPDFVAWFNDRYGTGVTLENNAALVLLALDGAELAALGAEKDPQPPIMLLGRLGDFGPLEKALKSLADGTGKMPGVGPLKVDFAEAFKEQQRRALLGPWSPEEAPLVSAWLRLNDETLERAVTAAQSRTRYFLPIAHGLAFDSASSSPFNLRSLGDALRCRALEELPQGYGASSRRDLLTSLRLAALLEQGPLAVDRLVAVGLKTSSAEALVPFSAAQDSTQAATELLRELRRLPPSAPMGEVVDVNERLTTLAGFIDLYRAGQASAEAWRARLQAVLDSQKETASLLQTSLPSPLWVEIPPSAIDWDELLRTVNRCWQNPSCDAEIKAAGSILEDPSRLRKLVEKARTDPAARRRLATTFVNVGPRYSLLRATVSWNESEALKRIDLVCAAAARLRTERGSYPAETSSLTSLVGFDPDSSGEGYSFSYRSSADGRVFSYGAQPLRPGETGVRSFCADAAGTLATHVEGAEVVLAGGLCDPAAKVLAARMPPPRP